MQELTVENTGEVESMPLTPSLPTDFVGPWGGGGGDPFEHPSGILEPSHIRVVTMRWGKVIDSIVVQSLDRNGKLTDPYGWGGSGGETSKTITIQDKQVPYGITVKSGTWVDYIELHVWDPMQGKLTYRFGNPRGGGLPQGVLFERTPGGPPYKEIYGFGGLAHTVIDAIGVYARFI